MPPDDELIFPVSLSPAGRDLSGILTFSAAVRNCGGKPLLLTRCSVIAFGPADVTRQIAFALTSPAATFRWAWTWLLPTATILSPPPEPPRNPASGPASFRTPPMAPRLIKMVPSSGPAVPDWKFDLSFTLCATTSRLVILTGPSGMCEELLVLWWKFRLMTWVRNGNPAIDTDGFFGKPCFWICVAAWVSAKALAPKSSPTRSTRTEMSQISALRPPRRFGGWYWYKRTASWS